MSKADELKTKNENLFERNTILINENERLKKEVEYQTKDCDKWKDMYKNRCEEYRQLEKENAELKSELTKKADTNHSLVEQMADLESENAELEQKNNKLLDVINNQDVKIADLEQQIEKMKCCGNCSEYDRYNRACSRTKFSVIETLCNCTNDWELRR